MPAKASLGNRCLTVVNTLAYYDMAKVTAIKIFIVQAPRVGAKKIWQQNHKKCFDSKANLKWLDNRTAHF